MPKIKIGDEISRRNQKLIALVREKPALYSSVTKRAEKIKDDWSSVSNALISNGFQKMSGECNYLKIFNEKAFLFYIISNEPVIKENINITYKIFLQQLFSVVCVYSHLIL